MNSGLDDRFESQVLGIEAPVWTEYIRDTRKLEFNIYPRLQSLAEICWTIRDRKDFADFEERLADFVKILDSKGIVHAPREAYLCEGEGSKERAENGWKLFESDPYSEMNTYLK